MNSEKVKSKFILLPLFFMLIFSLSISAGAASKIEGTTHYQMAGEVLTYLNASRKAAGVSSLKQDEYLEEIAMLRAAEISVKFSHTRPNGTSCFTAGSLTYFQAENIAKGQRTAKDVNTTWSNSPGHYQSMINKNYTGVGIGCFEAPDGTFYWVECFGVYRSPVTKTTDTSTVSANNKTCKITSAENLTSGIRIKWQKVAGISGYYVYRKTGSGSYSKIAAIKKDSTVSYKDKTVKGKNGTQYTYKVVPYTSSDKKTGSGTEMKIARLDRTKISNIKSNTAGTATVKWKKMSGVTGYKIYFSTSSSFSSSSYYVARGADTKKATIKNLTSGKTYYMKICSYKTVNGKEYNSPASKVKTISIK